MNARAALSLVLAALAGIIAWLVWPDPQSTAHTLTFSHPAPAVSPDWNPVRVATNDQMPPEPRSELADRLNSPTATIQADLRIVQEVIDAYRSNFHENPIGNNAEITSALTGRNELRLALLPADHPAINLKGELCDRWGRPFFFHQISGHQMEIRSSGPDHTMWTADDAILAAE